MVREDFNDVFDCQDAPDSSSRSSSNWGCVVLVLGIIFLIMLPDIISAIGKVIH
jgi:hypothetical protein